MLFKYRIISLFAIFKGGARTGRNIAIVIAFAAMTFAVVSMCVGIYTGLKASPELGARLLQALVLLAFHGIFILLLFTGLSLALFTVFFGKDLELLFSLPIKQTTIFIYKFVEALVLNVRFSMLFLTPALILLGLFYQASPIYYIMAVLIIVFMASIPGSLGIIISSLFVSKVSRPRMKNIMAVTGSFLGIALWAAINMLIGAFDLEPGQAITPDFPVLKLASSPAFDYLPSGWASHAAVGAAMGNWNSVLMPILFLAFCSIVLSYLAMKISARYYSRGVVEESPEAASVTAIASSLGGSPLMAHIKRDLILLYRQPLVSTHILLMFFLVLIFPYLPGHNQPGDFAVLPVSVPVAIFALIFGSQLGSRLIPLERLGFCHNLMIPGGTRLMLLEKLILGLGVIILLMVSAGSLHIGMGKAEGLDYILYLGAFSMIGLGVGLPMGIIFGDFTWEHPKRMLRGGGVFILIILTIVIGIGLYLLAVFAARFVPSTIALWILTVALLGVAMAVSYLKLTNFEWIS